MIYTSGSFSGMLCLETETELAREVGWFTSVKGSGEYFLWKLDVVVKKRNMFRSNCKAWFSSQTDTCLFIALNSSEKIPAYPFIQVDSNYLLSFFRIGSSMGERESLCRDGEGRHGRQRRAFTVAGPKELFCTRSVAYPVVLWQ